jgi:hypothetical protein
VGVGAEGGLEFTQKVILPEPVKRPWTIEGPFAPGEMPEEMQKQWDELKRTGIGPGHPDF